MVPTYTTPILSENVGNIIKVEMGNNYVSLLNTEGTIINFGKNNAGQLGLNFLANLEYPMKSKTNVVNMSSAYEHQVALTDNNKMYISGNIDKGKSGEVTNDGSYTIIFKEMTLPNVVTENNKIKYIGAGKQSTSIQLKDNTVYNTGENKNGELGVESTNVITTFTKAKMNT